MLLRRVSPADFHMESIVQDPLGPPFHECEVIFTKSIFKAFAVPSLKLKDFS